MAHRLIKYAGPLYQMLALREAKGFCPPIYPCKKCGHPVVTGYCCHGCGDTNPSEPPEGDKPCAR